MQYLGDQKISSIEKLESGESKVILKDNQTFVLPDVVVGQMITGKSADWGGASVNDYMLCLIADDLLGLLRDHYKLNVKSLDRLCSYMQNKSINDFNVAQGLLWGKGIYDVKLVDVQKVLVDASKEKKSEVQAQADTFQAERAASKQ